MDESKFMERLKNIGRNEKCPCESGKKYKKCHLNSDEAAKSEEMKKIEAENAKKAKTEETNETDSKNDEKVNNKKTGKKKHNSFKGGPKPKMKKNEKISNIPRRSAV